MDFARVEPRVRNQKIRLAHVPGRGRAPFGAQSAVDAEVLVLDHDPPGLWQVFGDEQGLLGVEERSHQPLGEILLGPVDGNREAVERADVEAGVALDAQVRLEMRLRVTIQAALDFGQRLLDVEAFLHLDVQPLEALLEVDVAHLGALGLVVVVGIRPLVQPHLLADQVHPLRRTIRERLLVAPGVDGNRRLMAVLDRPDDVLGAPRRVAAYEYPGTRRHEGGLVDDRHVPVVEVDPDVAFDPREGRVLPDGQDDLVALDDLAVVDLGTEPSALALVPGHQVEDHALQLAVFDDELRRGVVFQDLHLLLDGVLQLPGRCLEVGLGLPRHDLHVAGPEALGRAAAVHGGVPHADHEHPVAAALDVAEAHRLQPVDPDVNPVRVPPPGDLQFLPLRGPRPDEEGVVVLFQEGGQAVDRAVEAQVHPHVGDVLDLFPEDLARQPELGDVRPHQTAGRRQLLEDRDFVPQRHQVVCDGERGGPGADARDALPVLLFGNVRQEGPDVVPEIGGHPLQPADRHGLAVQPHAPADRFAGTVAGPAQDPGEDVGLPVEEVRLGVLPVGDEPDVFGDVGVRRASPLAVDNAVVVARVGGVGWFHQGRQCGYGFVCGP